MNVFLNVYRFLFARQCFYKMNKLLYQLSLRGLGILNFESDKVSGEKKFLTNYLVDSPEGACIIDAGANIGNYSKAILEINPTVNLYAFEPHPKTFKNLSINIKQENFFAINAAVGNEDGMLSLYDYEVEDGSSHASLYRDVIENIHHASSVEHNVKVVRLEDWLRSNCIEEVFLLKIDTEGNELNVLKGVSEYISTGKINAIHFEFNEMNVSSRAYFKDFWELLKGYDFYRLLPNGMIRIDTYHPVYCEIFAYQNIVALKKQLKN